MKTTSRIVLVLLVLFAAATVPAGASPAADPGEWTITPASGGYEVTWTSPEPLPVTSARPGILLDGQPVGPATVSPDGRTLSIAIPGEVPPTADRLGVELSGRILDQTPTALQGPSTPTWVAPAGAPPELGFDPGLKGSLQTRSDEYRRPSFKFPGMRRKLEVLGHVVAPADPSVAATAPLVLFLHGRHSACYRPGKRPSLDGRWPCRGGTRPVPSYLGYEYLQQNLASQGFVTVSIAANGVNDQDGPKPDGGAGARSALVRRHLDLWSRWVASGSREADLGRVVLVGHSRGGEGVNRAAEEIPADAPYRVVGQLLLAPTNFARQTAAYIPTVTVLPYCDGDVSDLQGQVYTDASIGLAAGDDSLKSSVVMFGANHNFFNTEWTPGISKAPSTDDWYGPPGSLCGPRSRTRLTAAQQRRVARSYVAGAVELMTGADDKPLALFDGSAVRVGPVARSTVASHSVGGGKLTLVAGREAKLAAKSGKAQICHGYTGGNSELNCGWLASSDLAPHWPGVLPRGLPTRPALEMEWKRPGTTARLTLDRELDLTGRASLDLRVVVNPWSRASRLGLSLVDADGRLLALDPESGGRVDSMPADRGNNVTTQGFFLARTLRVPIPTGATGPFDLSRVRTLVLSGEKKPSCGKGCPPDSQVWVLDISARSEGALPPLSADRLPLVSLKDVTRREGKGAGTVEVPFRVRGDVTEAGTRLRVLVDFDTGNFRTKAPQTVRLAPGQRRGTITVGYRRGRQGGRGDRTITVRAYPMRGAIPTPSTALIRLKRR